jgi:hypothetical protein
VEPGLYIDRILDDESLAGDLDEADATVLVNALVSRAEVGVRAAKTEEDADAVVSNLRATGRKIGKAVAVWHDDGPTAAAETAKKYGLSVPPTTATTTADVLKFYLDRLS